MTFEPVYVPVFRRPPNKFVRKFFYQGNGGNQDLDYVAECAEFLDRNKKTCYMTTYIIWKNSNPERYHLIVSEQHIEDKPDF